MDSLELHIGKLATSTMIVIFQRRRTSYLLLRVLRVNLTHVHPDCLSLGAPTEYLFFSSLNCLHIGTRLESHLLEA